MHAQQRCCCNGTCHFAKVWNRDAVWTSLFREHREHKTWETAADAQGQCTHSKLLGHR